jgi:hypothetical protein
LSNVPTTKYHSPISNTVEPTACAIAVPLWTVQAAVPLDETPIFLVYWAVVPPPALQIFKTLTDPTVEVYLIHPAIVIDDVDAIV